MPPPRLPSATGLFVAFALLLADTVTALHAGDPNAGPTRQAVAEAWARGEPMRILNEAAEAEKRGDYDAAIQCYNRTIALDPDFISAYFARGNEYLFKDATDLAAADFAYVIELDPKLEVAHRRLAECYRLNKDYDLALSEAASAIAMDPGKPAPYGDRGTIYFDQGDFDKAIADFNRDIELSAARPGGPAGYGIDVESVSENSNRMTNPGGEVVYQIPDDPYYWRGRAHAAKGDYDKAITDYDFRLRLSSQSAKVYFDRGIAYQRKGDAEKAMADFELSTQIDPQNPWPYNDLAWNWATNKSAAIRNGEHAVDYAKKACDLSKWSEPAIVDTLAAAYAEVGDFDQAVTYEKKYLEAPHLKASDAADGKSRLALYATHHAYHESDDFGNGPAADTARTTP